MGIWPSLCAQLPMDCTQVDAIFFRDSDCFRCASTRLISIGIVTAVRRDGAVRRVNWESDLA